MIAARSSAVGDVLSWEERGARRERCFRKQVSRCDPRRPACAETAIEVKAGVREYGGARRIRTLSHVAAHHHTSVILSSSVPLRECQGLGSDASRCSRQGASTWKSDGDLHIGALSSCGVAGAAGIVVGESDQVALTAALS